MDTFYQNNVDCPCRYCSESYRRTMIEIYGKNCHSDICPFGWEEWRAKEDRKNIKINAGRQADMEYTIAKVDQITYSKKYARTRK